MGTSGRRCYLGIGNPASPATPPPARPSLPVWYPRSSESSHARGWHLHTSSPSSPYSPSNSAPSSATPPPAQLKPHDESRIRALPAQARPSCVGCEAMEATREARERVRLLAR
jgi:hypothetical protein